MDLGESKGLKKHMVGPLPLFRRCALIKQIPPVNFWVTLLLKLKGLILSRQGNPFYSLKLQTENTIRCVILRSILT